MRFHFLTTSSLFCFLTAVSATMPGNVTASAAAQPVAAHISPVAPVVPARRAPDAPPGLPPALPPGAEHITPLTLEVVVRQQPASGSSLTVRQTISRTADRIHVAMHDGREWLFERNARDPRRVSGLLVERASRAIIVYEESDLRNILGIRGWTDVLTLGFDPMLLERLQRTTETRTLGGVRFVRYTAYRKNRPVDDVWWSTDSVFAGSFAISDGTGSTRFSTRRVRTGVNDVLLQAPASRFPSYLVVQVADWLDRH